MSIQHLRQRLRLRLRRRSHALDRVRSLTPHSQREQAAEGEYIRRHEKELLKAAKDKLKAAQAEVDAAQKKVDSHKK